MLITMAVLVSNAVAQEPVFDEFLYLPLVVKPTPALQSCNDYEPNNTPEKANWIQPGETQTQCIIPRTDVDWVKFSINGTSGVTIQAADPGGDLELTLYDGSLNELDHAYSWTNHPAQIEHLCGQFGDPLPAGTYYAKAEHWLNSEEVPSYSIALTVEICPTPIILTNHSSYSDGFSLHVLGEIQNNGSVGIRSIEVAAKLYNSNQDLLSRGTSYQALSILEPGDKTCFDISFYEFDGWSYYIFEVPTYWETTSDTLLRNMIVHSDSGNYNSGDYNVRGFVRNDNAFIVDSFEAIVTLYNTSGQVVGCRYEYYPNVDLVSGQSALFNIPFYSFDRDYADVTSYRIQIDAWPEE
jgi:hypothetical protein